MFDVDGVLADFIYGFTNTATGLGFLPAPWHTWDHPEWDFHQLTGEQVGKTWQRVAHSFTWWQELPALPDVTPELIERINQMPCEKVFTTHRSHGLPNPQYQTVKWLQMLGFERPSVVTSKRKGEVARALDVTHSIDDKVENANCTHWISDALPTKSFLVDRPYNQKGRVKRVIVVKTLKEFIDAAEQS